MYVEPLKYFFLTVPNNEGSATKYFEVPNNALPATNLVPNNATLFLMLPIVKDESSSDKLGLSCVNLSIA